MSNGTKAEWVSVKRRVRTVRVITAMKCSPTYRLVRVESGLPGETGRCFVVPAERLIEA